MWPVDVTALELTYQAIAAADAAQTASIAPPYHERCIDAIIGREPSGRSVAAWFGGMAIAHMLVTDGLLHWGRPWMPRVFEGVSIGFESEAVAWNISVGVKF